VEKIWKIAPADEQRVSMLADATGLSPALCRALLARGIDTVEQARTFLNADLSSLHDPFLMKDMDKAVARLKAAIRSREPILIYGDFDADGVTATALLVKGLDDLGATVSYCVPDRLQEGYGLNEDRIRAAHQDGVKLIVCVDNGIGSHDDVALANELGIDVIVTDHHEPRGDTLPPAIAVLDPKRADCPYPFRDLAGVGVAFKLYQALTGDITGLDLVALGTIADIVPLLDENRILVRGGLEEINARRRRGIEQLIEVSGLHDTTLSAQNVAFQLAPRINAGGRVGTAHVGVQLLLTNSVQVAAEIARALDQENVARRGIEEGIVEQADAILARTFSPSDRVIVLADPQWHAGVIGIAASRIVERYTRPTALIALSDAVGKGSARSLKAFDIHAALELCSDLLVTFGGHRLAAGFTIREDRIDELRDRLNRVATDLITDDALVPELKVDGVVALDEIDDRLVAQLGSFRPFGAGNPRPVFAARGVESVGTISVIRGSHIKFTVRQNDAWRAVIGFGMADIEPAVRAARRFDIAFSPRVNRWGERESIQLLLKDFRAP
jgi:single-stranded-DNA-specific exonuclease